MNRPTIIFPSIKNLTSTNSRLISSPKAYRRPRRPTVRRVTTLYLNTCVRLPYRRSAASTLSSSSAIKVSSVLYSNVRATHDPTSPMPSACFVGSCLDRPRRCTTKRCTYLVISTALASSVCVTSKATNRWPARVTPIEPSDILLRFGTVHLLASGCELGFQEDKATLACLKKLSISPVS